MILYSYQLVLFTYMHVYIAFTINNFNMIDNLKVTYQTEDINIALSPSDTYENIPYDLATIFSRIIKDSDANSDIVIEQLIEEFGKPEHVQFIYIIFVLINILGVFLYKSYKNYEPITLSGIWMEFQ